MSIQTQMVDNHISATSAKKSAEDAKKNAAAGNAVTERGTRIVKSNNEMDMTSFLKILSAEMQNLDPTSSNQDPTAQVTQMAQFSTMGILQSVGTDVSDATNNEMIGKRVILNTKDSNGNNITGVVNKVYKKLNDTFYDIDVDGKEKEYKASNVIGVDGSNTNTIADYRAALNSDFVAASSLSGKNVIISDVDENKKPILVKGKVTGSYIDTVNGAGVKVKVSLLDDSGNLTGKSQVYDYSNIVRGGDLENTDMSVSLPATGTIGTIGNSTTGVAKPLAATGANSSDTAQMYYDYVKAASKSADSSSTGTNSQNSSTTDANNAANTSGSSGSTTGA